MSRPITSETTSESVSDVIKAMSALHAKIGADLVQAREYIETGSTQNSVIGAMLSSEVPIKQMAALYDSLLALNQLRFGR